MRDFAGALRRVLDAPGDDQVLASEALAVAAQLWRVSAEVASTRERRRAARLARMVDDPSGRAFAVELADRVLRPPSAGRAARLLATALRRHGLPGFLGWPERLALLAGALAARVAPWWVMPAVRAAVRAQSAAVVLPGEAGRLRRRLRHRRAAGMRMNLNQLGEAILGEQEAARRLEAVLARLASPLCDYLSVKISSLCSQIHLVGREATHARLCARLRTIYRAAQQHGRGRPKFVNLDMEEYRDLHLTVQAFQQVLDEPEFLDLEAGIVLQAYLPDAWPLQRALCEWARRRVALGGACIKLRIVKGANLAMERVDAELHGWPQAPYLTKLEVDANFKRMLHEGCVPANAAVVRLGVASHNLFDIAYALLLRAREGVSGRVEFEMLEGMANPEARAVQAAAGAIVMYAPVVSAAEFVSALAYLVRRLDENTAEGNFLRDTFAMRPGDPRWLAQQQAFLAACQLKDSVAHGPRRTQDRSSQTATGTPAVPNNPAGPGGFANAADTDWSLPANLAWLGGCLAGAAAAGPRHIPLVIDGEERPGADIALGIDPSRRTPAYQYALAGPREVDAALAAALAGQADGPPPPAERARLLRAAAAELERARGGLLAAMLVDAGKSVSEADVEVSEAVDFANYYATHIPEDGDGLRCEPLGVVLVVPPWNFPLAIPCGGVLAALAAGNHVILKPATETVLTAWLLASCLWRAGFTRRQLQFVACADDATGRALVSDPRLGALVLTGAFATARMFLSWRPQLHLIAETSGKNALVITAAADLDLAIKDLVRSAFGHAGQKCSAASLALVEAGVYDHPRFRAQLRDAAASLVVGPADQLDATVTPLIRPPGEELERALRLLDPGEEWLLEPRQLGDNPCLWSPGIKLGVTRDSWFRRTECFGPVLGLLRVANLSEAIAIQNDSDFALTGGIHSLDPDEVDTWTAQAEVGNAYVNRAITGAIVRRQPFGGWKKSSCGPGAKAGGPNYVAQLARWHNHGLPEHLAEPLPPAADLLERLVALLPAAAAGLRAAAGSDAYWQAREFDCHHDPSALACERNPFRYRRFANALIRAEQDLPDAALARMLLVAAASRTPVTASLATPRAWLATLGMTVHIEPSAALAERLAAAGHDLVRAPHLLPELKRSATALGIRWADAPVLTNARREWPAWLREQSLSITNHRYGEKLHR